MNTGVNDILIYQNRVAYIRDEDAFKKLFLYFHGSLYRFAFHILHDADRAEEIVADVMMAIWEMGSTLAHVEKLPVYLFTAVRNNARRSLSKDQPTTSRLDFFYEDTLPATNNRENPEQACLSAELKHIIEMAIRSLPQQCQLVFRLIKEEGLAHKDVSKVLGISQNTIETQMRIALRKMQFALAGYLHPENNSRSLHGNTDKMTLIDIRSIYERRALL